ncbi:hypothetical protein LTR28_004954 [Elasticomyces elasticus]|nr:hypothetical protein LTR28_004954 [Elasticomyces elasticus]
MERTINLVECNFRQCRRAIAGYDTFYTLPKIAIACCLVALEVVHPRDTKAQTTLQDKNQSCFTKPVHTICVKRPSPLGSGLFVGLRSLDAILQYGILAQDYGSGIIQKLGGQTLPHGPPLITNTFVDQLGLSPYRMILFGMATGSALKQIYWLLDVSQEEFPPSTAVMVSAFNTAFNSINSLLFTSTYFSASVNGEHFPQTPLLVGAALYTVGILTETISEVQRKRFKADPKNKGKVYKDGLFGLARHINYGGYTLWRTGYSLAAGGWIWGAMVAGFFVTSFSVRGIPVLSHYCQERYGEQWDQYTRQTPYKLFPYIY